LASKTNNNIRPPWWHQRTENEFRVSRTVQRWLSEHSLRAKKRRTTKLSVAKVGGHCCYQFDTPSVVLAVGAGIVQLCSTFRAARRSKTFTALGFGEEPVA